MALNGSAARAVLLMSKRRCAGDGGGEPHLGFAGENRARPGEYGLSRSMRVTSLMGPTGSGKDDFFAHLNRMDDKVSSYRYSGDVLGGRSIFNRDVLEFRRVGICSSAESVVSIMDNVLAGVRAYKPVPRKEFQMASREPALPRSASGTRSRIGSAFTVFDSLMVSSGCLCLAR